MAAMFQADLTTEFLYRIVDDRRVLGGLDEVDGEIALLVVDPDAKDQPEVEDSAEVMVRQCKGTASVHGRQMRVYYVLIVRLLEKVA